MKTPLTYNELRNKLIEDCWYKLFSPAMELYVKKDYVEMYLNNCEGANIPPKAAADGVYCFTSMGAIALENLITRK